MQEYYERPSPIHGVLDFTFVECLKASAQALPLSAVFASHIQSCLRSSNGPHTSSLASWKGGESKMTEPAVRSWRFGVANRTCFFCAERTTPFVRTCTQRSVSDEPRVLLDRTELNAKVQLGLFP